MEERAREMIAIYHAKAKQCNDLELRRWWLAKAIALEQFFGFKIEACIV